MKAHRTRAYALLDRDELRRRATDAEAQLGPAAKAARATAILAERARLLARPLASEASSGASIEIVTFDLAGERYGVEARYVQEVARIVDLTPLPGAPDFIVGIVSLRGEIVAVVELRRLFGVATHGLTDLSRLIVLGLDRPELGILAEGADALTTLPLDEILDPPAAGASIGREHLRGVTRGARLLLDAEALLGDERLFINNADPTALDGEASAGYG
jgi:purine-binding chemotaxis protein CheW